jgi:hypothetical protein
LWVLPGIPASLPAGTHPKILDYLYRAVDLTEMVDTHTLAVYAKLPKALFFSPIIPASPKGWKQTRIHSGSGQISSSGQQISMLNFNAFVGSRIELAFSESMSGRQLAKLRETMLEDRERAVTSESIRVHLAGRRLLDHSPPPRKKV